MIEDANEKKPTEPAADEQAGIPVPDAAGPDVAAADATTGRDAGITPIAPSAPTPDHVLTEADTGPALEVRWATQPVPHGPQRGVGAWALSFAVAGLGVSFFAGWGFPLGLVAIILAIVAVRRPVESRTVGAWALVLGVLSVLYSAGWVFWAMTHPI